jgi:hypothetical protein
MRDTNALINKKVKKTTQVTGSKGTRQATKFAPQSPKQAKKEKEIMAREKRRAARNKFERKTKAIMTLGGSEVARKLVKSDTGQKIIKGAKKSIKGAIDAIKKVPSQAMTTGFNKKPSSFKLRSGNKPSIAKLAGIKRDPKDPFYKMPKGPEVKDNMPNQKPNPKFIQEGVNKGAFENLLPKGKNNNKKLPSDIFINLLPKQKPTGKINITKDIKKRK